MNDLAPWLPIKTLPARSEPGKRSASALVAVIAALNVKSPRYLARDITGDSRPETFCNIFVWDWSRCMGVEIPHWIDGQGNPTLPGATAQELTANRVVDWLKFCGPARGWREVEKVEANRLAALGMPVVAGWKNLTGGSGHVAPVLPPDKGYTMIAQAGPRNFERGTLEQGFGSRPVTFWANT